MAKIQEILGEMIYFAVEPEEIRSSTSAATQFINRMRKRMILLNFTDTTNEKAHS